MDAYKKLSKISVFSIEDVKKITGNEKTAYSLIERLMRKNLVEKIRNNIYSCVNPATGNIFASKYQIACSVNSEAYISHHTAFEFHGVANQVFYEVYISSSKRFRNFEYNSIRYKYVSSKLEKGIIKPKNTENIRVTNIERTLIDSIKDYKKIGGFEELINCIKNIYYLDEIKLKDYLDEYNIQALYQKTGFILKEFMDDLYISDEFIEYCKSKIGESTRYLIDKKEENYYDEDWKLVIPKDLFNKIDQGGGELV